jgi:hypothetical protein
MVRTSRGSRARISSSAVACACAAAKIAASSACSARRSWEQVRMIDMVDFRPIRPGDFTLQLKMSREPGGKNFWPKSMLVIPIVRLLGGR